MGFKNVKIGKVNDFKEGEMKNVSVGDGSEILVIKTKGKISALAAYCTHYGAPLAEGILNGDKIICPWHHACFNAHSGDLLEPPAFEALPKFNVLIDEDNVSVDLPDELPASRTPEMSTKENEDAVYAIVGGGSAGYGASQAMREAGFKGRIVMFTKENRTPYDRPNLSKDYLEGSAQPEWMPIRPDEFYKKYEIEVEFDRNVKSISKKNKKIVFDDGTDFKFDKVLIATGGVPIVFKMPGSNLKNIFYLRSFDNADAIIEAVKDSKKAVVIGSSFIGMETANCLLERKLDVTVVSMDKIPFEQTLGKEIGKLIKREHEKRGIKFKLGRKVKKFEGNEKLSSVLLDNGEKIDADIAVIGIGVKPATEIIDDVEKNSDGGIKVDETLKASDDIYAAGDVASFFNSYLNQHSRIEHWRTAMQQGRIAGFNMAGVKKEYASTPFFWTKQGSITIRYVGHAKKWDDIIFAGDINTEEFISFYVLEGRVIAAAGSNSDKELIAVQELLEKNKMPEASELKNKNLDLVKLLKL
jgi:apoptosis-inducing factor 3